MYKNYSTNLNNRPNKLDRILPSEDLKISQHKKEPRHNLEQQIGLKHRDLIWKD